MLGEASATARLKHLNAAVERSKSDAFEKHWLILVEAERATRAVAGAFCVFCKSGKDRTGMAVTLATAMLIRQPAAAAEGGPEEKVMLEHANLLREHGARIRICLKNTGRKKYAFNVIQREFLPYPYRPPMSCIEDLVSSIANADTS
ncbi:hypothetical protein M885DRAFT_439767 [Pelagophyceae sp. CCMP2097]|nr:hypothetical protein M885DRAFT_439767 [Pelagophyceae sp. CCMP2097]